MTTREVMLKWMRGGEVPGLPSNARPREKSRGGPAPHGGFDHARMRAQLSGEIAGYTTHGRGAYTLLVPKDSGAGLLNDALLAFGKFNGKRLSEIAEAEPTYLAWIANKAEEGGAIDDDLRDIAREWLEAMPEAARGKRAPRARRRKR